MKILLIAPHFYPDEHIGASRWNRLSKYLNRDGHEIYVIASNILGQSNKSSRSKKLMRVNYQSSIIDKFLFYSSNIKKLKVENIRQRSLPKKKIFFQIYIHFL